MLTENEDVIVAAELAYSAVLHRLDPEDAGKEMDELLNLFDHPDPYVRKNALMSCRSVIDKLTDKKQVERLEQRLIKMLQLESDPPLMSVLVTCGHLAARNPNLIVARMCIAGLPVDFSWVTLGKAALMHEENDFPGERLLLEEALQRGLERVSANSIRFSILWLCSRRRIAISACLPAPAARSRKCQSRLSKQKRLVKYFHATTSCSRRHMKHMDKMPRRQRRAARRQSARQAMCKVAPRMHWETMNALTAPRRNYRSRSCFRLCTKAPSDDRSGSPCGRRGPSLPAGCSPASIF